MNDQQLTPHFSLYELTVTLNAGLQEKNRDLTPDHVAKLAALAAHAETLRGVCGGTPLRVHSGYRCPELNGDTPGSASTSQHPKCEAIDFDVPGQTVEQTYAMVLAAARASRFKFGQIILEEADRGYKDATGVESIAKWVHCSVVGTLDPEKVGQVLLMNEGADKKLHYTLVTQIK